MASLKKSIVWTAVLLYHRLKVAARMNNRYRLNSKIISNEVIHRLALYFKQSSESICKIVGVNGRNTKDIYNRLVGRCQTFEIENCIYKKADQRILNNNTTSAIVSTEQSHLPGILSNIQQVHDILVCITNKDTNTISCNDNNPNSFSEQIIEKTCENLTLQTSFSYMNRRSSSRIATKKSLTFSKRIFIVPKNLIFGRKKYPMNINRRSSFRIATKKSVEFSHQSNTARDYQELILILNHRNNDALPYVRFSKKTKKMYAHCRCYVKQRKRTQPFFSAVGNCNEIQHVHHLYDPHVAGIYSPFIDKVIDDSTLPTINKAFVHDPTHPLLASSDNGIDLIYVPTIYSAFDLWKQCLTEEELVVINKLKIACTNLRLLLDFQLNEKFTIRTAIDVVSKIKTQYHHDVLHLRYSYHTISMCAEVHNFTSNKKKKL